MKHIQLKYNILQSVYWASTCALMAFITIFLQSKGLSNTQIGTVTGGGCILNIVLGPVLSSIIVRYHHISLQTNLTVGMIFTAIIYLALSLIQMPRLVVMCLYMLVYSINVSMVPLLASISMNYCVEGNQVNFGLARGLGSASYAIAAVCLTQICSIFDPDILSVIYLVGSLFFCLLLQITPKTYAKGTETMEKTESPFSIIGKYKAFFRILCGFSLMFAATTAMGTYLVNIINSLGGNQNLYGVAVFILSVAELPVMGCAQKLQKRFTSLQLIGVASVFYIFRISIVALAPNIPVLLVGLLFQGASYGLMTAIITVYVNESLEEEDQVMGQTMISVMTCGIGSCIGNWIGGILQDAYSITAMSYFSIVITLIGSMIILRVVIQSPRTILHRLYKYISSFSN